MTVRELIKELQEIENQDLPVKISHHDTLSDEWVLLDVDDAFATRKEGHGEYVFLS
jgi:hypothetical protein